MTHNATDDLALDVYYGHFFNLKCERIYRRLDFLLNVIQLVGGSGAMFAVLSGKPTLVAIVGVALAIAAALSLLIGPAAKAACHCHVKDKFTGLMGRYRSMRHDRLAEVIAEYRVGAPVGIDLLAMPAFNAAAAALGREDAVTRLTPAQRFVDILA